MEPSRSKGLDKKYLFEEIGGEIFSKITVKTIINKKFTLIANPQWSTVIISDNQMHRRNAPNCNNIENIYFNSIIFYNNPIAMLYTIKIDQPVTRLPSHRSLRAVFPHRAPRYCSLCTRSLCCNLFAVPHREVCICWSACLICICYTLKGISDLCGLHNTVIPFPMWSALPSQSTNEWSDSIKPFSLPSCVGLTCLALRRF